MQNSVVDCAIRQQSRQFIYLRNGSSGNILFVRREQAFRRYFNNKSSTAWESLMAGTVHRQHLHKSIVQMSQHFFNLWAQEQFSLIHWYA